MDNAKVDYYKMYEDQIKDLHTKEKPKLLLHVCCGPCSTFPLKELSKNFQVTIFYSNSNIYPYTEYDKRLKELEKVVSFYKKNGIILNMVVDPYKELQFKKIQKPYVQTPEGGKRCEACIEYRLKRTFEYAKKQHFEYFCSTMTVSQNKNATMINKIGSLICNNTKKPIFLFTNFKKKGGLEEGIFISKQLNLYRQNYCGCELSFNEMKSRVFSKNCGKM